MNIINISERRSGIVALFILAFIFSIFGIFSRYLNENFSVFQQLYLRIFAAILLSFIFFYKNLRFKRLFSLPKREWIVLLFRAMCFYALGAIFNVQSINLATYSNVTFLQAIPTTAILGMLFLQEKVSLKKIFIILFAFFGVLLIASKNLSHVFEWGRGETLALAADIFFSLLYISRKWHLNILNNKEISFMIFLLSFVMIFMLSMIFDHSLPVNGWQINYVYAIIGVAILIVVNQFLINYSFQYVEPFLANNIIALESVFALFIGLFLYREIVTLQQLAGGFLILLSVPLMNREEKKKV